MSFDPPGRFRGLCSLQVRFSVWLEHLIVTRIVKKRVGPLMRLVFKIPILFYRIGLGGLVGKQVLLLTTTGRKSGKLRQTPLEYSYDPQTGAYFLMSGWGGKSDWYLNARANPNVHLWVGKRRFAATAVPASDEDVVKVMLQVLQANPQVVKTWSGYTGVPYDGTQESLYRMAMGFPSLLVHPRGHSLVHFF